jgi:hypothetical protein
MVNHRSEAKVALVNRNFDLEACPPVSEHMLTWRERFMYQILITGCPLAPARKNLNTTAVNSYFLNKTALSYFPKHDGGDFLFSK